MIRRLLYRLTARRPCRLIHIDGRPYLERYYLGKVRGVTAYLHRFVGGDGERQVHDHPWGWALGLVLAGAYTEQRLTGLDPDIGWHARWRRVTWWRPNLITARTFHRIAKTEPETWTLFIHGPRVKGWGFLKVSDFPEIGAIYHQPYDVAAQGRWWTRAPKGAKAGRQPLRAAFLGKQADAG